MRQAAMLVAVLVATAASAAELSPDMRPVLILQPPQGELLLVHRVAHRSDKRALPRSWRTAEPDRGFTQALLMQLSHVAANWPWRSLIVSTSAAQSDSHLQTLNGQDAVVAVAHAELVDLGGKVEFHVTMDLVTVRAIATAQQQRAHTPVEYFAPLLLADSSLPRRSVPVFAMDGPLDDQVSTAATDLSQFLALIVARVSVPSSLHPHNSTLGALGLHPVCAECRASDPVVYQQPDRVWVRVGKPRGRILALPLRTSKAGPQGP
jgi:hypothetical protein